MKLLVDATGQPGPAAWEAGSYAEGTADQPVTGISWYEAAAYAEFAGKSLPTVYSPSLIQSAWQRQETCLVCPS